ncbi:pentapeptide repeat-containing protein [Paenibacillus sp. P26]|nr:pentapeptide repeat-containing protein [Paenibacillus sp. P26]
MNNTLRDGLIAELLFEGGARDTSGQDLSVEAAGAVLTSDRFGRADSAYAFDGKDDYVKIEPAPPHAGTLSVSVWVRYDEDARLGWWSNCIAGQDGHHRRRVFQLSTFDDRFTWHRFHQTDEVQDLKPLRRGVWYHLVGLFDGEKHKLYRDGALVSEKEGTLQLYPDEPLYIGRKSTDEPYFFFKGKIDDFRMYDRALTPEEITELYRENGWGVEKEETVAAAEQESAERLEIKKEDGARKLSVDGADISGSEIARSAARNLKFRQVRLDGLSVDCANLSGASFHDVNLTGVRIDDANLTGLEIDGAQWGGALFRNIGNMPPEWHPDYREGQRPKPVSFMNCDLRGGVFSDCNLGGVALRHCNFAGMTINGVPVEKAAGGLSGA